MAGFRKDLRRVQRIALDAGWRVEQTRNGHWRFLPPDRTVQPCVVGGTPSDHRAWANFIACLRRKGLDV